jgi:hypothetical protein
MLTAGPTAHIKWADQFLVLVKWSVLYEEHRLVVMGADHDS